MPTSPTRRPIKTRNAKWAVAVAAALARAGVRPNTISVCSALFAALAGLALASTPGTSPAAGAGWFIAAALGVQLRLLCNLFDGMVAVEGGFRTKSGEIFNELPDRFADAFILVGCGYATADLRGGVVLGWAAAVLAVVTAYVRTLGAAAGAGQCFLGPMAKPHRMAAVTAACLVAAAAGFWGWQQQVMLVALGFVLVGMGLTIFRRTRWIIRELEAK